MKYIEIEKAEAKYRRSHEEYKTSVALFGNARDDFERKMTLATRRFQVTTSLFTQNSVTKIILIKFMILDDSYISRKLKRLTSRN